MSGASALFFGLAAVLLVIGLAMVVSRRTQARAARTPRSVLRLVSGVADGVSQGAADVTGVLASPPQLRAPVTDRPCLVWEVTLLEYVGGEDSGFVPIWTDARCGDLAITYDVVADEALADPGIGRAPAPGQVILRGDRTKVTLASDGAQRPTFTGVGPAAAPVAPDLARFGAYGLPPELAGKVHADPERYRLVEAVLTTGDRIRARQGPMPLRGRLPDPDGAFQLVPVSDEQIRATALGCLARVALFAALVSAVVGLSQLR